MTSPHTPSVSRSRSRPAGSLAPGAKVFSSGASAGPAAFASTGRRRTTVSSTRRHATPSRGSPRAAAVRGRGDAEGPQPAQVQGGAGEVPLVAHLRHAAEDDATKAHRLLDLRVPTKDVPYARGPNSAAGRRGAVAAPMRRRGR